MIKICVDCNSRDFYKEQEDMVTHYYRCVNCHSCENFKEIVDDDDVNYPPLPPKIEKIRRREICEKCNSPDKVVTITISNIYQRCGFCQEPWCPKLVDENELKNGELPCPRPPSETMHTICARCYSRDLDTKRNLNGFIMWIRCKFCMPVNNINTYVPRTMDVKGDKLDLYPYPRPPKEVLPQHPRRQHPRRQHPPRQHPHRQHPYRQQP